METLSWKSHLQGMLFRSLTCLQYNQTIIPRPEMTLPALLAESAVKAKTAPRIPPDAVSNCKHKQLCAQNIIIYLCLKNKIRIQQIN